MENFGLEHLRDGYEDLRPEKTSVAIRDLAQHAGGRDVTVGEILAALKDRGFGVFMILFALPNAVIPGISFILGAPVVLLALQLAFGREEVWLPDFMRRQTLSAVLFEKIAARVERFLLWIEKRSMPRWCSIVTRPGERFLGLYIAVIAGFLMIPFPFGNVLPALGIALMSVGLIEKDGKAAVIGMVLGFLGALYIGVAVAAGVGAFKMVIKML
jgi:hypothetical protein